MTECNGYENWSTWLVAHYPANEEPAYNYICSRADGNPYSPGKAREVFREMYPNGTPEMKGRIPANINWREVADSYTELSRRS